MNDHRRISTLPLEVVLEQRDSTDPVSRPVVSEVRGDPPLVLGRLLAGLVPAGTLRETQQKVVAAIGALSGAQWGALYNIRPESGGYRYQGGFGDEIGLPEVIPADLALADAPAVRIRSATQLPATLELPTGLELVADFAIDAGDRGVVLLGARGPADEYDQAELAQLEVLIGACGGALGNAALFERLRSLVLLDPLTGCYNRRGFDEQLRVEFARAKRYERPLTLLLVDIDCFKRVNDEQGHDVGDMALRDLGGLLRGAFRSTDRVCRFGGDEFAIIFPETMRSDVVNLAERMRDRIQVHFESSVLRNPLTASFGIACFPDDASGDDDLLRSADQALYRAKEQGRNRIEVA